MSTALAELLRSPKLPEYSRQIQRHLAEHETLRRGFYEDITDSIKAEFINGEIIIHSPARLEHLNASSNLASLLMHFVRARDLGCVFVEKCLIRCEFNDYEPDLVFFGAEKAARIAPKQTIFPPPDLAVEILSPSTAARDRELKLTDYAANGIGEYWIVDADDRAVEQYGLDPALGAYRPLGRHGADARLASVVVPGFDIPVAAIFDGRENQRVLLALLQAG